MKPELNEADAERVDAYLVRLGVERASVKLDLASLGKLQAAHLTAVPFENVDIVAGRVPPVDPAVAIAKIVGRQQGGWCFELNAAFAWLLSALGFRVRLLGAAVLLHGPNEVLNHITIEVMFGDAPYITDVGFGDSFVRPLRLATDGPQKDPKGTFEFTDDGTGKITFFRVKEEGEPAPLFRFEVVERQLAEFRDTAKKLGEDPNVFFSQKPFATRLLDGGPARVTLVHNKLKITKGGETTETEVAAADWDNVLEKWFGFRRACDGNKGQLNGTTTA